MSAAGAKRAGSREVALPPPSKNCLTTVHFRAFLHVSSAQKSICFVRYMLSHVCSDLSVRPSVTRVDKSKTVEVMVMKFFTIR